MMIFELPWLNYLWYIGRRYSQLKIWTLEEKYFSSQRILLLFPNWFSQYVFQNQRNWWCQLGRHQISIEKLKTNWNMALKLCKSNWKLVEQDFIRKKAPICHFFSVWTIGQGRIYVHSNMLAFSLTRLSQETFSVYRSIFGSRMKFAYRIQNGRTIT